TLGGTKIDKLNSIIQSNDGGFVIAGYSMSNDIDLLPISPGTGWIFKLNPPIATSGPTTFCQGGSVTLTADQGNKYSWNTGATTRSITVSTSGSYSVTIDDCFTSAAVVTVNPPVTIISEPVAKIICL